MKLTQEQYDAILRRQGATGFAALAAAPKRQKYGNKKTIANGKVFASGLEARRYTELELMEKAGQIRNLQRQVPFDLIVNGEHVCTYVADAVYEQPMITGAFWETTVEDTKSPPTRKKPEYALKKKLMRACHGIEIREVMA